MRGNRLLGFIWILIAAFLIYILVAKITTGKKLFKHNGLVINKGLVIDSSSIGTAELYDTQIFPADKFDSFDISLTSESLFFEESSTNDVIVELYGTEETAPVIDVEGKTLSVESPSIKHSIINLGGRKVIIKLPKGYIAKSVDIDLSSGSTHITNCNFEILESKNSSGSVHIDNCKMNKAEVVSHSGSVNVNNCEIPVADLNSTSGSVRANGVFEKLKVHAVSGSVRVDLNKPLKEDSEINTTSGSVHITLPSNSDLKIKYAVTSGSYHNSLTHNSGKRGTDQIGEGGPTLEVGTTSGSININ